MASFKPKRLDSIDNCSNHVNMIGIQDKDGDNTRCIWVFPWYEDKVNPLVQNVLIHPLLLLTHIWPQSGYVMNSWLAVRPLGAPLKMSNGGNIFPLVSTVAARVTHLVPVVDARTCISFLGFKHFTWMKGGKGYRYLWSFLVTFPKMVTRLIRF